MTSVTSTYSALEAMQCKPFHIEIESLPERFHEYARDWSELAGTRLLAEPLFEETPSRRIRSTIIEDCRRIDALSWHLTLSENARWNNGDRITALEICDQILRARQSTAASLPVALMIESMTILSTRMVHFRTRIPVAHIERILANPGLAPHHNKPGVTTGPYILDSRSPSRICLRSARGGHAVNLIRVPHFSPNNEFEARRVDLSGPMSVDPAAWPTVSVSNKSMLCALDIVYALMLPESISPPLRRLIHARLDRRRICQASNGSVTPCTRLTDLWNNRTTDSVVSLKPLFSEKMPEEIQLLYTNFPGNREMALNIAQELHHEFGINISISSHEYSELMSDYHRHTAFQLILLSSPWPHPAAMLAPFFFGAKSDSEFQMIFRDAVAAETLVSASALATRAEDFLVNNGFRIVPLGGVMGCMRSHIGEFWIPPSGWIDYSQLIERKKELTSYAN